MLITWLAAILLLGWLDRSVSGESCDPRLPHCRNRQSQPGDGRPNDCKPFWLIPGKSEDCTKSSSPQMIRIDQDSVTISPNPVRLPGCFTISMNAELLAGNPNLPRNYLAKVEYDWWSFPQFATLPCQNTSTDGCGGFGNNCYYCDICNSLRELDSNGNVRSNSIGQQFNNIECPSRPGPYRLTRQFCFNDFNQFDKNNNCQPDFMEKNSEGTDSYKQAISNLEKLGFGTVTAKFTLAHNATRQQQGQKVGKEAELEQSVDADLMQKRVDNNWAVDNTQYLSFRNWYVQNRKDRWHKQDFMPWLLFNNEIACLTVNFEVCNKQPTPMARGSSTMHCL